MIASGIYITPSGVEQTFIPMRYCLPFREELVENFLEFSSDFVPVAAVFEIFDISIEFEASDESRNDLLAS